MKGMHRNLLFLVIGFVCAILTASCSTEVVAGPKERTLPEYLMGDEAQSARVYRKILPSVVTILTSQKAFQEGREVQQKAMGSGVLISARCHILTAAHVVSGAEEIMVKTQDEKMHPAEFLFSEAGADIALIRFIEPVPGLTHAELGDSDELGVGQGQDLTLEAPLGTRLLGVRL